jgi:hypothetical protein
VAERELTGGGSLPADALEEFVLEADHAPRARRVAFEWLVEVDPTGELGLGELDHVLEEVVDGGLEDEIVLLAFVGAGFRRLLGGFRRGFPPPQAGEEGELVGVGTLTHLAISLGFENASVSSVFYQKALIQAKASRGGFWLGVWDVV